jgi:hypothetical protein
MTTQSSKKNLSKSERSAYALVGRIGGKAMAKKHGKEHMSKIGKMGARARWHPERVIGYKLNEKGEVPKRQKDRRRVFIDDLVK